jgi:hypothetical protein
MSNREEPATSDASLPVFVAGTPMITLLRPPNSCSVAGMSPCAGRRALSTTGRIAHPVRHLADTALEDLPGVAKIRGLEPGQRRPQCPDHRAPIV